MNRWVIDDGEKVRTRYGRVRLESVALEKSPPALMSIRAPVAALTRSIVLDAAPATRRRTTLSGAVTPSIVDVPTEAMIPPVPAIVVSTSEFPPAPRPTTASSAAPRSGGRTAPSGRRW